MGFRNRLRTPGAWLAMFVLLGAIPLVALSWLAWRLLEQDRALDAQRVRERLDNAAALASRELGRSLDAWSNLLLPSLGGPVTIPRDTVLVVFDSAGVLRAEGTRLPYYPKVSSPAGPPAALLASAEAIEFRERDLTRAAASYRALAVSRDRGVRAAALLRLARVLRKQQHITDALTVYGELAALGETPTAGAPAELVGRRERYTLLTAAGQDLAAEDEAAQLTAALLDNRLLIDRATFEFYKEPMSIPDARFDAAALRLAQAADAMWPLWQAEADGRVGWNGQAGSYASVWRRTPAAHAAIVGRVDDLIASARSIASELQVRLTLEDEAGRLSWGAAIADNQRVSRAARETGLPWTIHVTLADPVAAEALSSARRNIFAAGFVLMLLVIAAAAYFVFRAVHRELGVARLQSDFVAAVSHEFRTPLTAMCHLTEMLDEGRTPADRLPHYYQALRRESHRLHSMVESLLDFGRIDAGQRVYQFVETDVTELVTQVVQECRDHGLSSAHRVEWQRATAAAAAPARVRADRDALALALRNLLDNAVKYSPDSTTVRVSVAPRGAFVGIAVEDEGVGIPKDEQRTIFRKFARGSAARTLNVKGTGIGLTMAHQIVRAHGGRLELVSAPGRGTTFTTLLPLQPEHP